MRMYDEKKNESTDRMPDRRTSATARARKQQRDPGGPEQSAKAMLQDGMRAHTGNDRRPSADLIHVPASVRRPGDRDVPNPGLAAAHMKMPAYGDRTNGTSSGGESDGWTPAMLPAEGGRGGDGGPGSPAKAAAPASSAPASAEIGAIHTPPKRLHKTTVAGPTTGNNGAYSWGVQWSVQHADASTNGWIVQKLDVQHNVHDAAGGVVTPGTGGYGGFPRTYCPYWEAWQVRNGSVYVGGSALPHHADTFAQGAVGANTRGRTREIGRANFYPNLVLPAAFTVKPGHPAGSLPNTNADPGLHGGTGELAHTLSATWDSVHGTGATTATTV
ncbi:MAG: hypothetical protein JST22_04705 [Bacteroidetes bacterium]|nr:hypothetical protein [Bacteroidota bacterium]